MFHSDSWLITSLFTVFQFLVVWIRETTCFNLEKKNNYLTLSSENLLSVSSAEWQWWSNTYLRIIEEMIRDVSNTWDGTYNQVHNRLFTTCQLSMATIQHGHKNTSQFNQIIRILWHASLFSQQLLSMTTPYSKKKWTFEVTSENFELGHFEYTRCKHRNS